MGRLDKKACIITGAALGIGSACALLFSREGAKVAVTDVRDEEGQALTDRIRERGHMATYWHLDVRDENEVHHVFQSIYNEFGWIHVLVNNAGIAGVNKPTHEVSLSEWERVMDVNVKGTFLCTKHAIPYMQRGRGGSIINLSSIYGLIGAPDVPAYHASKGAVRLMSKTDALIYAKDGIRVNSVHPGYIRTPMVEDVAEQSAEGPVAFFKKVDMLHPLGHIGDVDDVAHGVLYLASDESKFVTGSELVIDGGYTAQ